MTQKSCNMLENVANSPISGDSTSGLASEDVCILLSTSDLLLSPLNTGSSLNNINSADPMLSGGWM